jgi:hypothetical protein
VRIEECKPISKKKTWTVLDRIGVAKAATIEISEPAALSPEAGPATPVEETKADKPVKAKATKKAKAEDVADADA